MGRSAPFESTARWVDTAEGFDEILEELATIEAFAIDTEFHRERTYFPQLALVQLAWSDQRALVDPLAVDLIPFARVLNGPTRVVMHAGSQDLEILDLVCGALPQQLFDTQVAAGFVGHSLPSLSALVERFYDVTLPKGDRLTDWLRRPLNADQRTYAEGDVVYLLGLEEQLRSELTRRDRMAWAEAEFEVVRQKGRVVRDPDEAWLKIKEARSLRGEVAGAARAVAAWRERRAAELDQPVRFILSDMAVVAIAQRKPTSPSDLGRIRGVDARHVKGAVGEAIVDAVARGVDDPPPRRTNGRHELDRRLKPAATLVAAWVGQLARDLEVEPSLLATRNDIERLLAGDEGRLSEGWRAGLVGEPVRRLVEGEAALAFDGEGGLLLEPRSSSTS